MYTYHETIDSPIDFKQVQLMHCVYLENIMTLRPDIMISLYILVIQIQIRYPDLIRCYSDTSYTTVGCRIPL